MINDTNIITNNETSNPPIALCNEPPWETNDTEEKKVTTITDTESSNSFSTYVRLSDGVVEDKLTTGTEKWPYEAVTVTVDYINSKPSKKYPKSIPTRLPAGTFLKNELPIDATAIYKVTAEKVGKYSNWLNVEKVDF